MVLTPDSICSNCCPFFMIHNSHRHMKAFNAPVSSLLTELIIVRMFSLNFFTKMFFYKRLDSQKIYTYILSLFCHTMFFSESTWPPLWARGNIVASHSRPVFDPRLDQISWLSQKNLGPIHPWISLAIIISKIIHMGTNDH